SPVVVFFYGGDWQTGAKEDYRFVAQALTGRGFVTVLPDYRLYPQVRFPAFVNDAAAAVKWVHDHIALFGGDPHRVYLLGHSAGAHIVALLALDTHYLKDVGLAPAAIRATAGLAGPYDFRPRQEEFAVFGMASPASPVPPDIEPVHFADHVAPPMLLIHGAEDDIVGPENAANLSRKLKDAGSTVVWLEYPHAGHGGLIQSFAWPFRWMNPALCDVTHFFESH
ncbi:MAG: alpha/beta hydrolase, partial [Tepidisphaeraceae bacterium]